MGSDNYDSEIILWEEFLQGDANAYNLLMKMFYKDLLFYGQRFTNDNELVKDCIQEVFLKLWKTKHKLNRTQFVKFYLLTCLRRQIVSAMDSEKKFFTKNQLVFKDSPFVLKDKETEMIADEVVRERVYFVKKLLDGLPKRQQEILFLTYYMQADANQISEILNISKQSVYNLLNEAKKRLRNDNQE